MLIGRSRGDSRALHWPDFVAALANSHPGIRMLHVWWASHVHTAQQPRVTKVRLQCTGYIQHAWDMPTWNAST